jgi:hypothetical protein
VSRPWKNELRLSLRTNGCDAELRRSGWSRRVVASASASGRGAAAITAAIAALRMADIDLLTADARLIVADEYVDFALLGAEVSGPASRQRAADHFADALGHSELLVQTTPLPGARGWLAAAIDLSDYTAWIEALSIAGIQLRHVHPALVEDLNNLADRVEEDNAVLVLLREEGATLLRLGHGVPCAVSWERFDPSNHVALEARLRAFAKQTGSETGQDTAVYMLPQSQAVCRFVWDGRDKPATHVPTAAERAAAREAEDLARALRALRMRPGDGAKAMPPVPRPARPRVPTGLVGRHDQVRVSP